MNKVLGFIINRLSESSTYIGLFLIAGAFFGINLTDGQQEAIIYMGMALVAAPESKLRDIRSQVKSRG